MIDRDGDDMPAERWLYGSCIDRCKGSYGIAEQSLLDWTWSTIDAELDQLSRLIHTTGRPPLADGMYPRRT